VVSLPEIRSDAVESKTMSRAVQPSSEQPPACFACRRDCPIKGELLSLYTIAVKPNDYNTRLSEFVSQLFNALAQMVQRKDIQA
jgi:hypothetical protein